ncbi:MAG TPA: hypothetical protein VMB21_14215, partial [Candidatus Limnocylindria bacterium]|nr:hypothetical protein [Candidatus Limnocylindria bacterium]
MGEHGLIERTLTGLWRAGCPDNGHVRFGRRPGETDRPKDRHRAPGRPHNLVCDPSFLLVAWDRVRGNTGARTAGVDGQTVH